MEATVGGAASNTLYNNPSTFNTSLLYLTALVNNQRMKVMIDTGANRTFISTKSLYSTYDKRFVNRIHRRVFLADGFTSLSVYGEVKLHIILNGMHTFIQAFVVNELCADCILGMDFIKKYKLIINMGEQTVSVCNNNEQITLKIDVNKNNIRFPARLINNIRIPPKRTVSVPVSVELTSANVLFRPSFNL